MSIDAKEMARDAMANARSRRADSSEAEQKALKASSCADRAAFCSSSNRDCSSRCNWSMGGVYVMYGSRFIWCLLALAMAGSALTVAGILMLDRLLLISGFIAAYTAFAISWGFLSAC